MDNSKELINVLNQISKNIHTLNKNIEKLTNVQKDMTQIIFNNAGNELLEHTKNDEIRCEMIRWFKNKNSKIDDGR